MRIVSEKSHFHLVSLLLSLRLLSDNSRLIVCKCMALKPKIYVIWYFTDKIYWSWAILKIWWYRSIIPARRMLRWKNFDLNTYLSYIERLSQILYSKVGCGCSFLYTQHSGNWSRKIIKFGVSLGYLECSRQAWATEQDPVFKKKNVKCHRYSRVWWHSPLITPLETVTKKDNEVKASPGYTVNSK